MRVLFISRENSRSQINSLVREQGKSLIKQNISVEFYSIKGKGPFSYLRAILEIRKYLKKHDFDIVHAHYSLSAVASTLAGAKPFIVSLMGSDVKLNWIFRILVKVFIKSSWDNIIVKSKEMKDELRVKGIKVIPNGVNLDLFRQIDKDYCKATLNWSITSSHILFPSDPLRFEKNYTLTKSAIKLIQRPNLILHILNDIPHELVPVYLNASDVVVMSSLWEGSPNIIKEAMACNCPIVSTNVGDVKWLFGNEPGHFIAETSEIDFSEKVKQAIEFSGHMKYTNGRHRILELCLDDISISGKIIDLYKNIIG